MATSTSQTRTTTASAWSCASALLLAAALSGCGEPAIVPDNYAASTQEVRDCRRSGDHDLNYIRVVASQDAVAAYQERDRPFPEDALVVKVEYADEDCQDLVGFTAMQKLIEGAAPEAGDWHWQRLDDKRRVLEDGVPERCVSCHAPCQGGASGTGHDWTCTDP